jgi:fucose permease
MEFKKLEIKQDSSWFKRLITSAHFKKSILFILIGATAGFIFTYFSEGKEFSQIASKDIYTNMFTGAFVGFFLTNSPCARGKC